jgi:glycosyltransferase involved in cell wall biosynthesis
MSKVKRIIDIANREKNSVYNILTFPTHERYETQLCKTGHNFYALNIKDGKKWNESQTPIPHNYYILPENQACEYINYDFILVQSRYWQYEVASQLNRNLQIPMIVLDHTLPPEISENKLKSLKGMVGNINVFISEFSQNSWKIHDNATVIHHGIDSDMFTPKSIAREKYILTVANDFIKRNYCLHYDLWCELTDGLPNKVVGETEGLSKSASSLSELVDEYNKCQVYFNTSTTPIPMSLLEAMACGCAVVTVDASMMPEIIENGVNGFITNDKDELKKHLTELLNNDDLRETLGNNARKTILEKFSEQAFLNKWNSVFDNIYEVSTL